MYRRYGDRVSLLQQLVCFFGGTAILIRRHSLPMQLFEYRGGRGFFSKPSNFEPGRPLDIDRWPFRSRPVVD
jgi:hypothetical protein